MSIAGLQKAAELMANSSFSVALTGAGLSVDSGIPDFRSPGGIWERWDPMEFAHIDSFRRNPERVWGMIREIRALKSNARPNPGHEALAELERMGKLKGVITQNIDNLHQEAGNETVVEFHGNAQRLVCVFCGKRYDATEAGDPALGDPPVCSCGKILKPDFIFFGEAIPPNAYLKSLAMVEEAEVMLLVGTSAKVAPANMLPGIAVGSGARLIEVNLEPTHLTHAYGSVLLRGGTSEVLPLLVQEIKALMNP